ncbi:MAG: diacylglycerol kinase family protein [bacterium]|nr:diacylglycerol kinase family protein [bacterium]
MEKNFQKDKLKKKSFKRFIHSFKYALEGIKYAFYNEVNIFVMIIIAIVSVILGAILKLSYVECLVVVLLIGVILSLELINTAIEAVVDLATEKMHAKAKVAKDCASGAVAVMSIFAIILGLMIYLPKIIELFTR